MSNAKMAPKRNVKKTPATEKTVGEKSAKARMKIEKSKVKSPNIIKLRIPVTNNSGIVSKSTRSVTAKRAKKLEELNRMNEVAKAQLVHSSKLDVSQDTKKISKTTNSPKPIKKSDNPVRSKLKESVRNTAKKNVNKKMPAKIQQNKQIIKGKSKVTTKSNAEIKVTSKQMDYKSRDVVEEIISISSDENTVQKKIPNRDQGKNLTLPTEGNQISTLSLNEMPNECAIEKQNKCTSQMPNECTSQMQNECTSQMQNERTTQMQNECTSQIKDKPPVMSESPTTSPSKSASLTKSRQTSMASDCFSWTKDISNSSTTTCVTVYSNDIFRIDGKLPIVILNDVEKEATQNVLSQNNDEHSLSESETSSEILNSSSETGSSSDSDGNSVSYSLDLSKSSASNKSNNIIYAKGSDPENDENRGGINKISEALDNLSSKLKSLDMEITNWIGYNIENSSVNIKKLQEKIFKDLKEENEVILQCQRLKHVLSDNTHEDNVENDTIYDKSITETTCEEIDFPKPVSTVNLTKTVINRLQEEDPPTSNGGFMYSSFDRSYNDDDDALSLFAESITGLEPKLNSSVASIPNIEEYIPQLVSNTYNSTEKVDYKPTRIMDRFEDKVIYQNYKPKTICEKQNADSTSVHKELEQKTELNESTEKLEDVSTDRTVSPDKTLNRNGPTSNNLPCLMANSFKSLPFQKSTLFNEICFFNLISNCKKATCTYPHRILSNVEVLNKLMRMSEPQFIREYIKFREWPILRRKYMMCFITECARRELTRILVEMALDSVVKATDKSWMDTTLKVNAIEHTLLYLNNVDLKVCEDLLKFDTGQGILLCDVFIQTIADTTNFSRFKAVFIKLIHFMITCNRTYDLEVAENILLRVSILPYEEPLSRSLFKIIQNTDKKIFENPKMREFELQLQMYNKNLFTELISFKEPFSEPVYNNRIYTTPSHTNQDIDPINILKQNNDERRYTSPDTTNLDNANMTIKEPIITRTINLNKIYNRPTFSNTNSSSSETTEDKKMTMRPRGIFNRNWRLPEKRMFHPTQHPNYMLKMPMNTPPNLRMPNKRYMDQRYVAYGGSSSKFPRRSGPDFY